jgi:diguanylate cyclase (GGDEF)-like protein/PAS domain S-box-containing protein
MAAPSSHSPVPETDVALLQRQLALFMRWSDCLQQANDASGLARCLIEALTATGDYTHVSIHLCSSCGQGCGTEHDAWTFIPGAFVIPARHQGRHVGCLTLAMTGDAHPEAHLDVLVKLADDFAIAIEAQAAAAVHADLAGRHAMLSHAIEQNPHGVVITDPKGFILYCNHAFTTMTGYTLSELEGKTPALWKAGDTQADIYREMWDAANTGRIWQGNIRNRRKDGSLYWERQHIAPLRDANGEITWLFAIKEDITHLREVESALLLREQALASTNNGVMISRADADDHSILYVNPAFERITGYSAQEAIGRIGRFLVRDDLAQQGLDEIRTALRERRPAHAVLRNYRKDGAMFWNELYIAPISDATRDDITHFVSVINDVSDRLQYQEALEHQATHDSLTGLANRSLLNDRIAHAIAMAKRTSRQVAVALLDLDHFKHVNDAYGHTAGDILLREISVRLRRCVRETDTVARLGGDEFVVVLSDLAHPEDAEHVAQKIVEAMTEAILIDDREVYVGASVGLALYPRDGEHGEILLRNADIAMYRVKEHGRNSVRSFSPELADKALDRADMQGALRRALERNEFVLHYQPKVDVRSKRIVGAEALVRWNHPQVGLTHPGEFIPLAEETGLILQIGSWVMQDAFRQQAEWRKAGLPPLKISINISARQFRQEDLPDLVQYALVATGADPTAFIFEMTESMVMHDVDSALLTLRALKQLGITLSLDDFGTGYSSLSYLRRFPIDEVKIDRSFINELHHNEDDAAIAAAVVAMAHTLGLSVVAEGVEMDDQFATLHRMGCNEVQGYLLGRPMDADNFARHVREREVQAADEGGTHGSL